MNKGIQTIANRMTGNTAGILGILTSLVLTGAAGVLALDLASYSSSEMPVATSVAAVAAPAATGEAINRTIVIAALILGLAIVAPLVGAFSLFVLLKRYSGQMGPLIHIEYGAAPSVVVGPFTSRKMEAAEPDLVSLANAVERKRRLEGFDVHTAHLPTAESFAFGPSFEEELNVKRSQANRQDAAVLAQLFADNLILHEKIELDKETEKEHEAATETNN